MLRIGHQNCIILDYNIQSNILEKKSNLEHIFMSLIVLQKVLHL
jgi:hypothetical protein